MINVLSLFLSIFLITGTSANHQVVKSIENWRNNNKAPLYEGINQNLINNDADINDYYLPANGKFESKKGVVININQFSNSIDDFKSHYTQLFISGNLDIKMDGNVKWSDNQFTIETNEIDSGKWCTIKEVENQTSEFLRRDLTHAKLSYRCSLQSDRIVVQFKLETWASNNFNHYSFNVKTSSVKSNSTSDYDNIKKAIYEASKSHIIIDGKDLVESGSPLDPHNKELEITKIKSVIKDKFDELNDNRNTYNLWEPILFPKDKNPFNFSINQDKSGVYKVTATLNVNFKDPATSKDIFWSFNFAVSTNTEDISKDEINKRINITPGKVWVNNHLVDDKEKIVKEKNEYIYVYSAPIIFHYVSPSLQNEVIIVNGHPQRLDTGSYICEMTDNGTDNKYNITIKDIDNKSDKDIFNRTYQINCNPVNLKLKGLTWNPSQNESQKNIIKPKNDDKSNNPDYNPNVNPDTGIIDNDLLWVDDEKTAGNFAQDPIFNKNSPKGFIAQGLSSVYGISQNYKPDDLNRLERLEIVELEPTTWKEIGKPKNITDDPNFSCQGVYRYQLIDSKGFISYKLIDTTQQDYTRNYSGFYKLHKNTGKIQNFWNTNQGLHLKNYLVQEQKIKPENISSLTYEDVIGYWKSYVSDSGTGDYSDVSAYGGMIDLSKINLEIIKLSEEDINKLQADILNGQNNQANGSAGITSLLGTYGLKNQIDYEVQNLTDDNLKKLLNFDSSGMASLTLNVQADINSCIAKNSLQVEVVNYRTKISAGIVDLSKIKSFDLNYDFSNENPEILNYWIILYVKNYLKLTPYIDSKGQSNELIYDVDYTILNIDNNNLQNLISKDMSSLTITVQSLKTPTAINSFQLTLYNDVSSSEPGLYPPYPPGPVPPVDPENPKSVNPISFFLPLILILGTGSLFIVFWWHNNHNRKIK